MCRMILHTRTHFNLQIKLAKTSICTIKHISFLVDIWRLERVSNIVWLLFYLESPSYSVCVLVHSDLSDEEIGKTCADFVASSFILKI